MLFGLLTPHDELDPDGPPGQPGQRALDRGQQPVLQPVLGVSVLDTNDKSAILLLQQPGIA